MSFKHGDVGIIVKKVISGEATAREAILELKARGMANHLASMNVFIALGGDDVVIEDQNGVPRYYNSGKSVEEVRRMMGDVYTALDGADPDDEGHNYESPSGDKSSPKGEQA